MSFEDPSDAWIEDDTFIRHFFQAFAKPKLVCEIHYGQPMWAADGEQLRKEVQTWINNELTEMRKAWGLPLEPIPPNFSPPNHS